MHIHRSNWWGMIGMGRVGEGGVVGVWRGVFGGICANQ